MSLEAKKSVIMKLIKAMDSEMSDKLKPEGETEIEITKMETEPKDMMKRLEDGGEESSDEYDKEDSDIASFLGSPTTDGEEEDMSVLDRFKKKYQKED